MDTVRRRREIRAAVLLFAAVFAASSVFLYFKCVNRLLVSALNHEDRRMVRQWVRLGGSIHTRDGNGDSVLMSAAAGEDPAFLREVLARGADVNARDLSGSTALIWAASAGSDWAVELLLAHGADIHARDSAGNDALSTAAGSGNPAVVRRLLAAGAAVNVGTDMDDPPLMRAASFGFAYRNIAPLVEAGADVDAQDRSGRTALMQAAWIPGELTETVQALLDLGANPNLKDHKGATALTVALRHRHFKIARLLREAAQKWRASGSRKAQPAHVR